MTDFLKKNIDERRDSFDVFDTDLDLAWENIDKRLNGGKKSRKVVPMWGWSGKVARAAAAVTLLLAASITFMWNGAGSSKSQPTLSMVSPEMAETEQYYAMMISEKMNEIEANGQWVDKEVVEDMLALDQAYTELQTDLADNVDNEEVIHAMIVNYKIKLDILDRILAQIKEAKNGAGRKESSL
ncbi:MAG: hypothetical protein RIF36_06405 [Imperialibacter sp.]|uniref:hypothetical protein n=1 Tax=Imperialibacter sp. TaxID=2038411 RepID=UPI0032EFFE99